MIRNFLLLYLILSFSNLNAQFNNCLYSNINSIDDKIIINKNVDDLEIKSIVLNISEKLNIDYNFTIYNYPNFNNCAALNYYGHKIIIYDPIFLKKISKNKKSVITSILAHEIAHHLLNHTSIYTSNLEEKRKRELEADYISAVIMKKLGYTLNQSIEGVEQLNDFNDNDFNSTHPLKEKRNLIITEVFETKNENISKYIETIIDYSKREAREIINTKNYDRALNLIDSNEIKKAIIELNKLQQINEFLYVVAQLKLVELYRENGNESNCINILLELERKLNNPKFVVNQFNLSHKESFISNHIYFNIAGSYELQKNYVLALEYYKKAYNNLKDDKIIKSKIGILNNKIGNYIEALGYLNDYEIDIAYLNNKFSPKLFKELFDSRINTFEKNNIDKEAIIKFYNLILNDFSFVLNDNDKLLYLTDYTILLINEFELKKKHHYETLIYESFVIYKNLKDITANNSNKYLIILSDFYKKYSFLFDINSKINTEINSFKK
ncbi:MAG: hypothetical protein EKK56_01945 [Flavobacteriaceae bacterium]|nr:MAG: hypothetical protein EKK56_01945 [Flavobacteriaceae bacterium]